ncbi:MAG: hypothetical protein J6A25_00440 [Lachnospiraceae bacterium]|nr:hypothetical protein [Lachnospiraceae bacterium]
MARLVYAKDDKIMVSSENIPTKDDTVAVDSIEALKNYKLIYETKESKEDARVIMGSTTGIPTEDDDEIYKAVASVEPEEEPKETPTETEEPGNEPDISVDETEEAE